MSTVNDVGLQKKKQIEEINNQNKESAIMDFIFFRIFIFAVALESCQPDKLLKDFTAIRYKETALGYQYSKEVITYKGKQFKPVLSEKYKNGHLVFVEIFKSEGRLKYNLDDLTNDRILVQYLNLNIADRRELLFNENYLIDNMKKLMIADNIENKIYCFIDKGLVIYNLE